MKKEKERKEGREGRERETTGLILYPSVGVIITKRRRRKNKE